MFRLNIRTVTNAALLTACSCVVLNYLKIWALSINKIAMVALSAAMPLPPSSARPVDLICLGYGVVAVAVVLLVAIFTRLLPGLCCLCCLKLSGKCS